MRSKMIILFLCIGKDGIKEYGRKKSALERAQEKWCFQFTYNKITYT
jgi:hypothetical protein